MSKAETTKINIPDATIADLKQRIAVLVDETVGWKPTHLFLPEEGVPVIGYNPEWVHEDYNRNGIRECGRYDGGNWVSAEWNNTHDTWDAVNEAPTHWMFQPPVPTAKGVPASSPEAPAPWPPPRVAAPSPDPTTAATAAPLTLHIGYNFDESTVEILGPKGAEIVIIEYDLADPDDQSNSDAEFRVTKNRPDIGSLVELNG